MLRGDAERKKKKDGGIPLNRDGLGVLIEAGEEKKKQVLRCKSFEG